MLLKAFFPLSTAISASFGVEIRKRIKIKIYGLAEHRAICNKKDENVFQTMSGIPIKYLIYKLSQRLIFV